MASTISAGTTAGTAIVVSGDTSGNLSLLSGATTVVAVTSTGASVTGTLSATGVSTFAAGTALLPALTTTGDTNTGVWFPAADTIAASTGGTEQMRIDSAGLLKFNSGYGSVATAYGCRAWVNFNGTGTVAIRASGNVSSITDNGAGDYTVNFTTAMVDANYVATFGPVTRTGPDSNCMVRYSNSMGTYSLTTTTYRFGTGDIAGALVAQDAVSILAAFHR